MRVRMKTWTGLCGKFKAHLIFERAERAKRDLNPLLAVPASAPLRPNHLRRDLVVRVIEPA